MDAQMEAVLQQKRDVDQSLVMLKNQIAGMTDEKNQKQQKLKEELEKAEEAGEQYSQALGQAIESVTEQAA